MRALIFLALASLPLAAAPAPRPRPERPRPSMAGLYVLRDHEGGIVSGSEPGDDFLFLLREDGTCRRTGRGKWYEGWWRMTDYEGLQLEEVRIDGELFGAHSEWCLTLFNGRPLTPLVTLERLGR